MKQVSRLKITPRIQHRKTTVRCPGCEETQNIRRSHRRNIAERLLSLFGCRPFRCNACGLRFWDSYKVIRFEKRQ